ncbi:type III-B CRISPR module-associated Cmr3 family protein [Candidatus Viridilinea mediisalina]|uniref:CRISPR-associated RAMP protein Csx10 n=1 Tax=Candidatus Viridilinea mediisalina TaxID=2024553 RepID=A0A2A6RMC8_9CHLR|nr:type III-B CRISPR module-associated Cmr3 family protein [Candidatus Viridilinea mediisalina]PDW04093.1 hypothetical protein CJ255_05220 [Candidatus Viridilinea mediisalina]
MKLLTFQIEALAPLAFPERKPGVQFNKSLPYVPGAAIYGALGQQVGEEGFAAACFRSLRCHNAYPCHPDDAWVRPLPATAMQPKGAEKGVAPHDTLVARVAWEHQQPTTLIYAPTDDDGRPYEATGTKFYTHAADRVAYREVQQRILTRVAINRERGTAQANRLYSPLAISEVADDRRPTCFLGSLLVRNEDVAPITAALLAITHLGGRQTSGLGAVRIALRHEAPPVDNATAVRQRVAALTSRFQTQAAFYERLGGCTWPIAECSIFTINLLADAILLEHGWLPTQSFTPAALEETTGIKARLLRSFTTTKPVGGWHTLWQRPKPNTVAVSMGGLYLFQAEHTLDDKACANLAQLQHEGIGERRSEGFGQVRVCDEFHARQ